MRILFVMLGALAMVLLMGCESGDSNGNFWKEKTDPVNSSTPTETSPSTPAPSQPATPSQPSAPSTPTTPPDDSGGASDEVPYSALSFTYGGVNGSGASLSSPRISGLRIGGGHMSYSWAGPNLSSWGMSSSQADALCCLFVQKGDGAWVGGKFDWISSSRTSRDLGHVTGGYGGWSLAGVPNPCNAAFVIMSADGRRRSNVIAGTWQR